MKVQTTKVYKILMESQKRVTVMQGGRGSGKTYNILIWFLVKLLSTPNKSLTICRMSMPAMKRSVMKDFIDILKQYGLYDEQKHMISNSSYTLANGSTIEFISADDGQRLRGSKRDYLYINESNEITKDVWLQLVMRTTDKIVIDYNPSDAFSYIYDSVITRDDADFYITTYLDNPFLPQSQVEEIERLKDTDENYWKVYGLGQKGNAENIIYSHYKMCDVLPNKGEQWYGLDFGHTNPSVLIKVELYDGNLYVQELIYQTKLITSELIDQLKDLGIKSHEEIFGDSASAGAIDEIRRAGYNIKISKKDVKEGIMKVKSMPLYVTKSSSNLLKEFKMYKWKTDSNGNSFDEPVKLFDHGCDAMRYAIYTKLARPKISSFVIDI